MVARSKDQSAAKNGESVGHSGQLDTVDSENTELTILEQEAIERITDGVTRSERLPDFQSQDELLEFLQGKFGGITSGDELLGNEYEREDESEAMKRKLIGVPLAITEYFFSLSDKFMRNGKYAGYVNVKAVRLDTMEKVAFADGSTGIAKQLADHYQQTHRPGGILCKKGIRVSEYDYIERDENGDIIEQSPAATFYLDE